MPDNHNRRLRWLLEYMNMVNGVLTCTERQKLAQLNRFYR